jgi:hypothetical protein
VSITLSKKHARAKRCTMLAFKRLENTFVWLLKRIMRFNVAQWPFSLLGSRHHQRTCGTPPARHGNVRALRQRGPHTVHVSHRLLRATVFRSRRRVQKRSIRDVPRQAEGVRRGGTRDMLSSGVSGSLGSRVFAEPTPAQHLRLLLCRLLLCRLPRLRWLLRTLLMVRALVDSESVTHGKADSFPSASATSQCNHGEIHGHIAASASPAVLRDGRYQAHKSRCYNHRSRGWALPTMCRVQPRLRSDSRSLRIWELWRMELLRPSVVR